MSRRFEAPSATTLDSGPWKGSTEHDHPAFGQVVVTRWTSGGSGHRLFGSDLSHSTGITIKLSRANLRRGLSSDWIHATEPVAEFSMSESQWARMVSSIGVGSGVPVTLMAYREGSFFQPPMIAAPELSRKELHGEEMRQRMTEALQEAMAQVNRLGSMIDEGKIGKKDLRELHSTLARAVSHMPGNVAFAFDTFTEAIEQVVDEAKTEVEAHVGALAMRIGLDEIRKSAPRFEHQPSPSELPPASEHSHG
jgi:hypothetical protein